MSDPRSVVIIGAGVAGLTAATLLAERGVKVTLLEAEPEIGGQAKSGRTKEGFPTEHSLRIYHSDYHCYFNILKKIPYKNRSVFENLTFCAQYYLCFDKDQVFIPKPNKFSLPILRTPYLIKFILFLYKKGVKLNEILTILKIDGLYHLSEERLKDMIGGKDVSQLLHLDSASKAMHEIVLSNLTIAAGVTKDSAAEIAVQLISACKPNQIFHMMNGPTSERVFQPWQKYLETLGVKLSTKTRVLNFNLEGNKINSCQLEDGQTITADAFILATSVLQTRKFISEGKLSLCFKEGAEKFLHCEWSDGVQFYLKSFPKSTKQKPHIFKPGVLQNHINSPWKLVSILEGVDFWQDPNLPPDCQCVLSVTFSDSTTPGLKIKKPLLECTPDEIKEEMLYQCEFTETNSVLDARLCDYIKFMDDSAYKENQRNFPPHYAHQQKNGQWILNFAPLFTPKPGYYFHMPKAKTAIHNFYLAGQYCYTTIHVPTMEKASESGFRAAIALSEDWGIMDKPTLPFSDYNHWAHTFTRVLDHYWYGWMKKIFSRS